MRDLLAEIDAWRRDGSGLALATVVSTWGSAPRAAGSKMAIAPPHRLAGSVSGGCIEGAVFEAGLQTLASGTPALLRFGVADETAWSVGLSCGGEVEVLVEKYDPMFHDAVLEVVRSEREGTVVTLLEPGEALGRHVLILPDGHSLGSIGSELDVLGRAEAQRGAKTRKVVLGSSPGVSAFVERLLPPPLLVTVGGVHITRCLVALSKAVGFRTVVVDPRPAFGSAERFPHADRLLGTWPDEALASLPLTEHTAVAVLTHDPKLDDPALRVALASQAFYVGALGSRATQEKRRLRLLAEGVTEEQLARLHAPIGLDLGGREPEEIALSVLAQIVSVRSGRKGPR